MIQMANNYLLVFHAVEDINEGIKDAGNDPDFSSPPSWGICRPNIRRAVKVDSLLVFVGYIKPNNYYVKGWFEVGEKIGHHEALEKFPNHRNVIIREGNLDTALRRYKNKDKIKWRYPERKEIYDEKNNNNIPLFLLTIRAKNKTFIQSPEDYHEIDNWKCSRIFGCNKNIFSKCILSNGCHKKGELGNPKYENYIVAKRNRWMDIGRMKIEWKELKTKLFLSMTLKTPKGQHNPIRISDREMNSIIEFLKKRSIV